MNRPPTASIRTGVLANVLQLLKLPDGTVKVLVEGSAACPITGFVPNDNYFEADLRAADRRGRRPTRCRPR
jgi:ATP-dependent Lon protease